MSLPEHFSMKAPHGKTVNIPTVGYGTWASDGTSWAKDAILTALKEGYRHIDGAWWYGVDEAVGAAIKESKIPREEIFITSKASPQFLAPEHVELCLDRVLKAAELDYVDLFLAHWPVPWKPISTEALTTAVARPTSADDSKGYVEDSNGQPVLDWAHVSGPIARKANREGSFVATWKAMQELVKKGKARAIGVSNFSMADIEELLEHSQEIPISCNQVEVHPWLPQKELITFHEKHGIVTACYSPFAGQKADGQTLLKDQRVIEIAKANDMDVGQLLQSWAVQRGTIPLGKSATPSRIKSNLDIRKLSDDDMKALDGLELPGDEGRTVSPGSVWGAELF